MKNVSFLVAFLAFLQIATGSRAFAQQQLSDDARRTVEEALDLAGEDIGRELEDLAQQLGLTADKLGAHLERWAEEHSDELEAWSRKHSQEWEAWGERFSQNIEGLAEDQEAVWSQWSKRYENNLQKWANELESVDELSTDLIGEFVDDSLKSLSKMPLGQLVDQALQDGVGGLSDAPWESLGELGDLAKDAFEEPIAELAVVLEPGSDERMALQRGGRELSKAVERLKQDVGRNVSDTDAEVDPRLQALIKLRKRGGLTAEQQDRIEILIQSIEDSQKDKLRDARTIPAAPRRRVELKRDIDVPKRDQIKAKIEREQQRHEETMQQFNDDLQRSSEEAKQNDRRRSDRRAREMDLRTPKRADGKNLSGVRKGVDKLRTDAPARSQQITRDGKQKRKPAKAKVAAEQTNQAAKESKAASDIEMLREEIARLRKEVRELKQDRDRN